MVKKSGKSTEASTRNAPKPLIRVKLTSGDSIIQLKKRMIVSNEEGYVIVHPDEYEELKALKVC